MRYDHNSNKLVSPTAEISVVASLEESGIVNKAGNLYSSRDAFARLRTSNPYTLFDSTFVYSDNSNDWASSTSGSATSTFTQNESAVFLSTTTSSGDQAIRESRRVFSYQPGKSLLILCSFVMSPSQENLRQRIGYFSTQNGIYLEQDGTDVYIVKRSYVSGSVVNTRISQSEWNVNKLDGTDQHKTTLDLSKAQIFWTDLEWLGVGSVRAGFVINGQFILCHIFHHANQTNSIYMSSASLPIRVEITNTDTISEAATLKQICCSVISEGGYEDHSSHWSATRTTALTSSTSYSPVVSIRMNSGRENSIILPTQIHVTGDGNNAFYEWALIRNAAITGGTWSNHTPSSNNVQYNSNATSMSGGIVVNSGVFSSTTQGSAALNLDLAYNYSLQLGRDLTPTSDTMTLSVRHLAVGGNVYGSLNWHDLT